MRAQWQALRAACFDRQVVRFLSDRPDATVVALGEGLGTQFWRVDNGRLPRLRDGLLSIMLARLGR